MTTTARMPNALYGGYGAYELKARYQRNMLIAVSAIVAFVFLVILGIFIYRQLTAVETIYGQPTVIKTIADLGPPPTVAKKPPRMDISAPEQAKPKVGIPKPVADDEVLDDEDVMIASREELADIVTPDISAATSGGEDIVIDIPDEEYMPAPGEFVPVEIQAEMIEEAVPEYPRQAKLAGMEAVVWVQALVDKNGDVREARILKSSGSKAGFDEAAIVAAKKCKFKPAIQNGRPVPVWVSFSIEFELTDTN